MGSEVLYKNDEFMVAWSIERELAVEVGPWPDRTGWSDRYQCISCCGSTLNQIAAAKRPKCYSIWQHRC